MGFSRFLRNIYYISRIFNNKRFLKFCLVGAVICAVVFMARMPKSNATIQIVTSQSITSDGTEVVQGSNAYLSFVESQRSEQNDLINDMRRYLVSCNASQRDELARFVRHIFEYSTTGSANYKFCVIRNDNVNWYSETNPKFEVFSVNTSPNVTTRTTVNAFGSNGLYYELPTNVYSDCRVWAVWHEGDVLKFNITDRVVDRVLPPSIFDGFSDNWFDLLHELGFNNTLWEQYISSTVGSINSKLSSIERDVTTIKTTIEGQTSQIVGAIGSQGQATTSAINQQGQATQSAINSQTQQQQQQHNEIMSENREGIDTNLPTVNINDPTTAGVSQIFDTLRAVMTNSQASDLVIHLPFYDVDFVVPHNLIDSLMTDEFALLKTIIQTVWWYYIARFVVLDIHAYIEAIKNGDVNEYESDIKTSML